MLADQPYSPVTSTHGESDKRGDTITLSIFSSSTSLINLHNSSVDVFACSKACFSSLDSSNSNPSFVAQINFLPSYSFNCWTAYSSIGSTNYNTSTPFFFNLSINGEFSTAYDFLLLRNRFLLVFLTFLKCNYLN